MAAKPKSGVSKDFPLSYHKGSGQYCKKVKGVVYYFGTDADKALRRWLDEKDAIASGSRPSSKAKSGGARVDELANVFLAAQRERNETTGKPGKRHIDLCEKSIGRLIEFVGKGCIVDQLAPGDYAKIKSALFNPVRRKQPVEGRIRGQTVTRRSPETVAGDVRRIRTFLTWCHNMEHIAKPRYGGMFPVDTEVAITKESFKRNRKDIPAADILAVINRASVRLKPIVLLAINAGIGNTDIASIEWGDIENIDQPECWVDLPRLKTGADRRFILWPETQAAIQAYLPHRRTYEGAKYAHLVFLTSRNSPWVRGDGESDRVDSLAVTFRKLRMDLGISRGSFYDLRRTFRTVAGNVKDREAIDLVMGHANDRSDMGAVYNQGIDDERIRAVCDYVRKWLFAK